MYKLNTQAVENFLKTRSRWELAFRTGLHIRTVNKLISGVYEFTPREATKISLAKALKVDRDEVFENVINPS